MEQFSLQKRVRKFIPKFIYRIEPQNKYKRKDTQHNNKKMRQSAKWNLVLMPMQTIIQL